MKTEVLLWKHINWCFPCTNAGGILKCSNRRSFAICVWGELVQETWLIIGRLAISNAFGLKSVYEKFCFQSWRISGDGSTNRRIKAPLSNFFVVLCGLSHATHRLVVNSDLFEGRDGGSKVLVLYLRARRLGSSLLAPPTLPGLARSKLLWRKWERPLPIFVNNALSRVYVVFQISKDKWKAQVDPRMKVAWYAEDLNNETKVSYGFKQGLLYTLQ